MKNDRLFYLFCAKHSKWKGKCKTLLMCRHVAVWFIFIWKIQQLSQSQNCNAMRRNHRKVNNDSLDYASQLLFFSFRTNAVKTRTHNSGIVEEKANGVAATRESMASFGLHCKSRRYTVIRSDFEMRRIQRDVDSRRVLAPSPTSHGRWDPRQA